MGASTAFPTVPRVATDTEARAGTLATVAVTPANLTARACFLAHKNGSAQANIASITMTTVTFGTEAFDQGGHFASDTWTPPAGPVRLRAQLFISAGAFTDGSQALAAILKNGALFAEHVIRLGSTANGFSLAVEKLDVANGTDAYTVQVYATTSAGTYSVGGAATDSYFMGEQI